MNYILEVRLADGSWDDSAVGDRNEPRSVKDCEEDAAALCKLGGEWNCDYRIVNADSRKVVVLLSAARYGRRRHRTL